MKKHHLAQWVMDCILLCLTVGSLAGAFLHSIFIPVSYFRLILMITGLFILLGLVMWNKWAALVLSIPVVVFLLLNYLLAESNPWLETFFSFVYWQILYIGGLTPLEEAYVTSTVWFWTILVSILYFVLLIKLRRFILPFLLGAVFLAILWFLGHESIIRYLWIFALGFLLAWGGSYHKKLSKQFSMPALGYWQAHLFPLLIVMVITAALITPNPSNNLRWNALVDGVKDIEDRINDRFGFTAPRQSFRLSESGFPSSQNELGGPVQLSGDLVLEVRSLAPLYLRGTILNEYISTGWRNTMDDIRYRFHNRSWQGTRISTFNFDEPVWGRLEDKYLEEFYPQINAEITHVGINSSVLFNSQQLSDLNASRGASTPYFNEKGETFTTRNVRNHEPYEIVSRVPRLANPDFRDYIKDTSPSIDWDQPLPESLWGGSHAYRNKLELIQQNYMNLPPDLPDRIYDLVDDLTQNAPNSLETVLLIHNFLQTNYNYTLEPPYTPVDRDFVDYFLFDLGEGYCTYFATAMTVMTRAAGIPARYVEGFLMPSTPNLRGIYEVKKLNGHAWVEVYFPNIGWLPFDPTPPDAIGESSGSGAFSGDNQDTYWEDYWEKIMEEQDRQQQNDLPPFPELPGREEEETDLSMRQIVMISILGFVGILFLAAGILFLRYRLHWAKVSKESLNTQYQVYYQEILWLLKLYGFPIKQGETPYVYAERVDKWLINSEGSMEDISGILVKSQFGHYVLEAADIAHIKAFYRSIRNNIVEIIGYPQFLIQTLRR